MNKNRVTFVIFLHCPVSNCNTKIKTGSFIPIDFSSSKTITELGEQK